MNAWVSFFEAGLLRQPAAKDVIWIVVAIISMHRGMTTVDLLVVYHCSVEC